MFKFNPFTATLDMVQVLDESIAHSSLSDMPDSSGVNTDHDARYFTEVETTSLLADKLTATDLFPSCDTRYLQSTDIPIESDPIYSSSIAASLASSDLTNLHNLSGTNTGDQDLSGYEELPDFPAAPKAPWYYILNDELWYYDSGTTTWSRVGKLKGQPLKWSILCNQYADWLDPTTYPAHTLKFENNSLPIMMLKRVKQRKPIDHVRRYKAIITGDTTSFTGQAGDMINITYNNGDGVGDVTLEDINLATCTGLFYPPSNNTRVQYQIEKPKYFIPSTNLISYWRFEEGTGTLAADSEGTNDGTLVNTPTWTAGGKGLGDYRLDFNGTDELVDVGNCLNFERTDTISVSSWFITSSSGTCTIISRRDRSAGASAAGWAVLIGSGQIYFQMYGASNQLQVRTNATYNDGNWHNVVVTYDGSSAASGVKIYVDGSLVAMTTVTNTLASSVVNGANANIGAMDNGYFYFSGTLDEVAVWSSVLDQDDVDTIFEETAVVTSPVICSNDGSNHLQIKNGYMTDTPSHGARGAGCTIQINKGTNNLNADVLTRLGFTEGQNASGTDGTDYTDHKGARFMPFNPLSETARTTGIYTLSSDQLRPLKHYTFSNWARDYNQNMVIFNESAKQLFIVPDGVKQQWGDMIMEELY